MSTGFSSAVNQAYCSQVASNSWRDSLRVTKSTEDNNNKGGRTSSSPEVVLRDLKEFSCAGAHLLPPSGEVRRGVATEDKRWDSRRRKTVYRVDHRAGAPTQYCIWIVYVEDARLCMERIIERTQNCIWWMQGQLLYFTGYNYLVSC